MSSIVLVPERVTMGFVLGDPLPSSAVVCSLIVERTNEQRSRSPA